VIKYFSILFIIVISSCTLNDYYWEIPEDIQTIEQARDLMQSFDYIRSSDWELPDITYENGAGGCTSLSGLFAYILKYKLNYADVKLIACETAKGAGHMVAYADGSFYEGQTGELVYNEYSLLYMISVEDYIKKTRYR